MFQGGIITKHTSLLDFAKLGYSARATILLGLSKESRSDAKRFLTLHPNVNSLYKINNGYDYLVEGVFHNLREIDEFLDSVEEKFTIQQKQVYYIIDELAREKFLEEEIFNPRP